MSARDVRAAGSTASTRVIHTGAFAASLAVGALLHSLQRGEPLLSGDTVVVIVATALLVRPTSLRRLVALLGTFTVEAVASSPYGFNHSLLLGTLGLATVVWWVAGERDLDDVWRRVVPALRAALVLVWIAAALAKLNTGFLDPVQSCAVWMIDRMPGPAAPEAIAPLAIGGSILIELAVPVALVFRRTRGVGVALAWLFHLLASLAGHTAFSGLAWSLYLLFLTPETVAAAVRVARQRAGRLGVGIERLAGGTAAWPLLAALWLGAVALARSLPFPWDVRVMQRGTMLVYVVWATAWAWALLRGPDHPAVIDRLGIRRASPVLTAALVALVLLATSPYVGLRTLPAFTMYSNLQTAPGHWNHLLVPESVRIFGWQDDVLTVVEVEPPRADDPALVGTSGPAFAIRTWLRDDETAVVRPLDDDGEVRKLERGDLPAWLARVAGFRPMLSPPRCQV